MKRFLLLGAFSAAALCVPAARAACGPARSPAAPSAAVDPVKDLVAILSETKSMDTYLTVVVTLGRMGAEARPAVGAIVRNGERLGIFEGSFGGGGATGAQAPVIDALAAIVQGQPLTSLPPSQPGWPAARPSPAQGQVVTSVPPTQQRIVPPLPPLPPIGVPPQPPDFPCPLPVENPRTGSR
jgi:hypothetical protein